MITSLARGRTLGASAVVVLAAACSASSTGPTGIAASRASIDGGPLALTCVRTHDACAHDWDCCSDFCMGEGDRDRAFCQERAPACVDPGGLCNADRDCCGAPCVNHRCDGATCAPLNGACTGTGRPCCEGVCVVASEGRRTCQIFAVDAGPVAAPSLPE